MTTLANYSLKSIKSFRGMEGHGYSANLVLDGKKVAEVLDDASGGPLRIDWLDTEYVNGQRRQWNDEIETQRMTKQEAAFEALVMALPQRKCEYAESGLRYDSSDIVIEEMVNDQLGMKKLKSMLKTKVLIVKGGALYSMKMIDLGRQVAAYMQKYPEAKILNTMEEQAAFDLAKSVGAL